MSFAFSPGSNPIRNATELKQAMEMDVITRALQQSRLNKGTHEGRNHMGLCYAFKDSFPHVVLVNTVWDIHVFTLMP